MMRTKAHMAVLVVFTALLASCGNDETKATGPAASPEAPRAEDKCEAAWTKLVNSSKVGTVTTYHVTTTTDTAGNVPLTVKSERRETITEATPEQVSHESATKDLQPAGPESKVTITLKKADFIQSCNTPTPATPEGFKTEVLEEKDESVTVPAGTFASHYIKSKVTSTAGGHETINETWVTTDEASRLAKAVSVSTIKQGSESTKTSTTTELVKLEIP